MENTTIVETHSLTKRYGSGVLAVDSVDMSVRRGDVYGFLGPNGAGKTTTLRMALGLIMPSDGVVELFGRDPMRAGARALAGVAGFVEAPRFYPYLSARKNLELLAALDRGDGRGVYEGAMSDLRRQGGAGYRIRTTDDERAMTIARGREGIEEVARDEHGICFQADERHVSTLTIALGAAGVGILALTPELAT